MLEILTHALFMAGSMCVNGAGPSGPTTPGRSRDGGMLRTQPLDPVTSWVQDGYGHENELRGYRNSRAREDSQQARSEVAYGATRGSSALRSGPRSDWVSGSGGEQADARGAALGRDGKRPSGAGRHEAGQSTVQGRRPGAGVGRAGRAPANTQAFEAELGLFLGDDLEVEDEEAGGGKDAVSPDDISKRASDVSKEGPSDVFKGQAGGHSDDGSPVAPGTSAKNPFALREPRARAEPLFPSAASRLSHEEGRGKATPESTSDRLHRADAGPPTGQERRLTRSAADTRSRVHG